MADLRVLVQESPFDFGAEVADLKRRDIGAVLGFLGVVRDSDGTLEALELEHYPAMTESALHEIGEKALGRWDLTAVTIIHRYGRLNAGEDIMMVATASAHRREAFEAADFLMDYLKSNAPFWKKEHRKDGASWVAARAQDQKDLARWDQ